jgi:hypothetical protein
VRGASLTLPPYIDYRDTRAAASHCLFFPPVFSLSSVFYSSPTCRRAWVGGVRTGGTAIIIARHTPKAAVEPSRYSHCRPSQEPAQKILESKKKDGNKKQGAGGAAGLREGEEVVLEGKEDQCVKTTQSLARTPGVLWSSSLTAFSERGVWPWGGGGRLPCWAAQWRRWPFWRPPWWNARSRTTRRRCSLMGRGGFSSPDPYTTPGAPLM